MTSAVQNNGLGFVPVPLSNNAVDEEALAPETGAEAEVVADPSSYSETSATGDEGVSIAVPRGSDRYFVSHSVGALIGSQAFLGSSLADTVTDILSASTLALVSAGLLAVAGAAVAIGARLTTRKLNLNEMVEDALCTGRLKNDEVEKLLERYSVLKQKIAEYGLAATNAELFDLAMDNVVEEIRYAARLFLGAISERSSLEAVLNRERFLAELFGVRMPKGAFRNRYTEQRDDLKKYDLGDGFKMVLTIGQYESFCGLRLELKLDDAMIGAIGFQETASAIEVVHLQGGWMGEELAEVISQRFQDISGGVNPMPWLTFATGKILLSYSQSRGKALKWIAGEQIRNGYPHFYVEESPWVTNIEEGRNFWEHPPVGDFEALETELSQITERLGGRGLGPEEKWNLEGRKYDIELVLKQYHAGPVVRRLYEVAAEQLGFRGGPKKPWHVYTKSPADFGKAVHSRDTDQQKFDSLVMAFERKVRR